MKRRSFLTRLTTLGSWLLMRPTLHADAVKADPKPAIGSEIITRHLWDGETRIEQQTPPYGFDGLEPRPPRLSDYGEVYTRRCAHLTGATRFTRTITSIDQLDLNVPTIHVHYEYVSGPKWWAPVIPRRDLYAKVELTREMIEASRFPR